MASHRLGQTRGNPCFLFGLFPGMCWQITQSPRACVVPGASVDMALFIPSLLSLPSHSLGVYKHLPMCQSFSQRPVNWDLSSIALVRSDFS